MSFFIATCPNCGERFTHLFVGTTLHSGHKCLKPRPLGFENPQTPPKTNAPARIHSSGEGKI